MTAVAPFVDEEVLDLVKTGSIEFHDLLKRVGREDPPPEAPSTRIPAALTNDEIEAVQALVSVYGSVVPTERRSLEPSEVTALIRERRVLKKVEKAVSRRVDDIRDIIHNHLDLEVEEAGVEAPLTKDGHYVHGGVVDPEPGEEADRFRREVRSGTADLRADALAELAKDPDSPITHEDYLAMTEQTRVVHPLKVMEHLKKNPHLVAAIGAATHKSLPSAGIYVRRIQ